MNKNDKENDKLKNDLNTNSIEESKSNNPKIIINSKLDLNKISLNTILHENLLNFDGDYFKKLYEQAEKEESKELEDGYEIKEEIVFPNPNILKNNDINNNKINNKHIKKELEEPNENKKTNEEKKEKEKEKNKIPNTKKEIKKKSKSDSTIKEIKYKKNNLLNNNNINKSISINHIFKINIIYFEIKYDTQMGECISVIGSIDKLGDWKSEKALRLNWNEGNIWTGSFEYKEEKDFEYKFILLNNGYVKEWENGINRKLIFQQIKSLIEPNLANGNNIKIKNIINQTLEYDYNNLSLKIISKWNIK